MTRLCDTHPYIFKHFSLGLHVVRRWAGLSSDLVSEQVRMRRMKTSGGTCEMLEFLQSINPFIDNCNLRSVATDINAERRVNVGAAKTVGMNLLEKMADKNVLQHTFTKKDQVVTLWASAVKINQETIQIDPQLLFQRLITAGTQTFQLEEIFQYVAIHQQSFNRSIS